MLRRLQCPKTLLAGIADWRLRQILHSSMSKTQPCCTNTVSYTTQKVYQISIFIFCTALPLKEDSARADFRAAWMLIFVGDWIHRRRSLGDHRRRSLLGDFQDYIREDVNGWTHCVQDVQVAVLHSRTSILIEHLMHFEAWRFWSRILKPGDLLNLFCCFFEPLACLICRHTINDCQRYLMDRILPGQES